MAPTRQTCGDVALIRPAPAAVLADLSGTPASAGLRIKKGGTAAPPFNPVWKTPDYSAAALSTFTVTPGPMVEDRAIFFM